MKLPDLKKLNPRYVAMIVLAGVAIFCASFALSETSHYVALLDAVGAGFNIAGIFYNWLMLRMDRSMERMRKLCDEMLEVHRAVIHGAGMTLHLMGPFPPDDDEIPPRRTLN